MADSDTSQQTAESWKFDAKPDAAADSLLECLLIVGKLYNTSLSADVLTSGLPLIDSRLTPEIFLRVAKKATFTAKIVETALEDLEKVYSGHALFIRCTNQLGHSRDYIDWISKPNTR